MRILIVGGAGMIGSLLVRLLRERGHDVIVNSRRAHDGLGDVTRLDMRALPDAADLQEMLCGYDVVVNAAGVGPASDANDHEAVHNYGACRLFDACFIAGVPRVVQLSALGDPATGSFIASKHIADAYLLGLPIEACVVRPSLVFSLAAPSTKLLLNLARLPWIAMPDAGGALIHPIHAEDLAECLANLVCSGEVAGGIVEIGGAQTMSMAEYIASLRGLLGKPAPRFVRLPDLFARCAFDLLGAVGSSVGGAQTLRVMRAPNISTASRTEEILGRPPRPVSRFMECREPQAVFAI